MSKEQLNETAETPEVDNAIKSIGMSKNLAEYNMDRSFKAAIDTYESDLQDLQDVLFQLKLKRIDLVLLAQSDLSYAEMQTEIAKVNSKYSIPKSLIKVRQVFDTVADDKQNVEKAFVMAMNTPMEAVDEGDETAILNRMSLMSTTMESVTDAATPENLASLLTLYSEVQFLERELQNENNFTVIAPPVQADSDFLNFKVTATPEQTNTLAAHKSVIDFSFDVPVKGGLKVDFSVGPAFAFGSGAQDEKFYLEESETDGMSILRERDNNNAVNPGVGAFMHIYKRQGKNLAFGGLFGVGAGFQSLDDANLSFYTGVSLIMGKKQKVMLNAGLSFLNVERLKESEFVVGEEYTTADFNLGDVTEKVFKGSFFISITYNLTNRSER